MNMKIDQFTVTVSQLIQKAEKKLGEAGIEHARLEAELLLSCACGLRRLDIYLQKNKRICAEDQNTFERILNQRCSGVPCAYIVGTQDFFGIPLQVDERVLIPRSETECLVEHVLHILRQWYKDAVNIKIVDIGTGSGAIAAALAANLDNVSIFAVDISGDALKVAAKNISRFGLAKKIELIRSDCLDCFESARGKIDLIVSNPPYIIRDEMIHLQREVRHEPRIALDGGKKGTRVLEKIVHQSYALLKHNGYLALEIDSRQADYMTALLSQIGYKEIIVKKDYAGLDRMVIARSNHYV